MRRDGIKRLAWIAFALAAATLPAARNPAASERIAAIVNKEVILESDVDDQLRVAMANLHVDPGDSVSVAKLRKDVLRQLIDEQVILAEAQRQNITIPKTDLDQAVKEAIQNVKKRLGSEQNFKRALAEEHTTEEALRLKYEPDVRKQLVVMRLVSREVQNKTIVTDAEARAYFTAHRDSLGKKAEQLKLSAIVIGFEPDSIQVKKLHARADSLRSLIVVKKMPFEDVAKKFSDDPSGVRGGDLGTFARGDMVGEFEDVAFGLKPMEVSQPVRSRYGWHLIQVLEKFGKTDSTGERVHARHVLLQAQIRPGDEERARKRALGVRDSLLKGAEFAAMAKRFSMDTSTKDSGGYLGEVPVTGLPPTFQEPLTGLREGEVSVPLKGEAGYYVFKLGGRTPEREFQFDEVKEELKQIVLNQKLRDAYDRWLDRIRKNVNIEVKD
ncbi:MAG TPA: peptidylprolyl isomerase [Candidatus Eisenbacteria bacterium]|nr:peptidylprolyl isomerase [Candidatus Eisenbacteria bacterium]